MSKSTIAPQANPERIERVLARRASNAAGKHSDRRFRRQRTRSAAIRAAVKVA